MVSVGVMIKKSVTLDRSFAEEATFDGAVDARLNKMGVCNAKHACWPRMCREDR